MKADSIGEAELNAYVDGQLDATGRIEVEDHLSRHPDIAAQVMADLRTRDMLRLAFPADTASASVATRAAARKLENALSARRILVPLRRLAAACALFALGWGASLGWTELNRPPNQTAMLAQAAKLGEDMGVRLPRLPEGWFILAATRAETPNGPGVHLTFQTPEFGRLSLVARNTSDVDFITPTIDGGKNASTIHWQLISDRYDLTANLAPKPLEFAALELFQTLY